MPDVHYSFFMRFVLRTWKKQAEFDGKEPFSNDPQSYCVVLDGPVVGRIYPNPVNKGMWDWYLHSPTQGSGHANSLQQAKDDLKAKWFVETKKLSTH